MERKPSYAELVQKIHDLEARMGREVKEVDAGVVRPLDISANADTPSNREDLTAAKEMLQMVMDNIPQYIFWKKIHACALLSLPR